MKALTLLHALVLFLALSFAANADVPLNKLVTVGPVTVVASAPQATGNLIFDLLSAGHLRLMLWTQNAQTQVMVATVTFQIDGNDPVTITSDPSAVFALVGDPLGVGSTLLDFKIGTAKSSVVIKSISVTELPPGPTTTF